MQPHNFTAGLNIASNPAIKEDWYTNPKTDEVIDFTYFARTEGRFAKQVRQRGKPFRSDFSIERRQTEKLAITPGTCRSYLKDLSSFKYCLGRNYRLE